MVAGALLGVGIGLSLLGGISGAASARESARYNAAAAEQDIKLMKFAGKQAMRDARFQGASDIGAIETTVATSGVKMEGSALDAIMWQSEQNAQNEYNVALETDVQIANRRSGAALNTASARDAATGMILGAAGSALSTGAMYARG